MKVFDISGIASLELAGPRLPCVALPAQLDSQLDSKAAMRDPCNLLSGNNDIMVLCSDSINKKILAH